MKKDEKKILDTSVEMAKLENNDLVDFIQNESYLSNKALETETNNNLPDYEY